MIEYIKIETPFERDVDGTKKLIEGKYRNETVEYIKDNVWQFTEKIDGTNIGIYWDGHKVTYQGRTERAQIPTHLINKLTEMFGGDINEELFEQKFGKSMDDVFGHTIEKYLSLEMLSRENDIIRLTDRGIDVSNIIFSDFIL